MEDNEEEKFGNALNIIEGMGAMSLSSIFSGFNGSFRNAWVANKSELYEKIKSRAIAELILENRGKINPEKEWQKNLNSGISAVCLDNDFYPALLREITHPPSLLYFKGNIEELNLGISASIVGTRRASVYGLETAFKLSRELAELGINIVSGLALGIDAKAHLGCISGKGKTFAVLGSGLSKILPITNYRIAEKIVETGGALLSEYPPEFNADKWTFPQRNRIIAGLSKIIIIIEAPEKSGSLITARFALEADRDIGVVPGEIFSYMAKGSNKLLKQGAYPILEASDALEILGILESNEKVQEKIFDEDEIKILNNINNELISFDELYNSAGLDIKIFNQKLSMLEIKGAVKNINGSYKLN